MVDCLGEMRRDGIIACCVWVSGLIESLCIAGRREDFWKGDGPIPDWRMDELQTELNHGQWVARWGLYGPKRIVQAQFDEIKEVLAKRVPTGVVTGQLFLGEGEAGVDASLVPPEHGAMLVGVPSLYSISIVNWPIPRDREGGGKPAHGDYAPVIPNRGDLVLEWMKICKPICEAHGIELMVGCDTHCATVPPAETY